MIEPVTASGLILGAAISFVPALILSFAQASYQRKSDKSKFLFDKRYEALKECAAAIGNQEEVYVAFREVLDRLRAVQLPPTIEEFTAILKLGDHLQQARMRYDAEVRTHAVLVASLFKRPFLTTSPIQVPPVSSSGAVSPSEQGAIFTKHVEILRTSIQAANVSWVALTNQHQAYLQELGSTLTDV